MEHELKILSEYFEEVIHNRKRFEIRKNDRDFKTGDILFLKEWDGKYTGRVCSVRVEFMLKDTDFKGVALGFCVMSINVRYLGDATDEPFVLDYLI